MERLTVWENLNTFARLWDAPRNRAAALLNRLDLGGRRDVRVDRLTPGEAARLRLARALVHGPSVLLLDEPAAQAPPARQAGDPAPARTRRPVPHVAARKGDRVLLFRPEEIRYAYARDKAVYIETPEGACGVSFTLAELEERLADSGFFRSHKAYLVNLAYVREIAAWTRDSYSLILKSGEEVPLSKHRAHELRGRLNG